MNFRKMSAGYRWYCWKQEHKRELDFYLICLIITVLLLLAVPLLFWSGDRFSSGPRIIDSIRYIPDPAEK